MLLLHDQVGVRRVPDRSEYVPADDLRNLVCLFGGVEGPGSSANFVSESSWVTTS
jgi:hypothetical protein